MFTNDETVGLAEWIIDDTCLVTFYFPSTFRLVVITIFTHVVRPSVFLYVRLYVRVYLSKSTIIKLFTADRDCGLAEWIIEMTAVLVTFYFPSTFRQ